MDLGLLLLLGNWKSCSGQVVGDGDLTGAFVVGYKIVKEDQNKQNPKYTVCRTDFKILKYLTEKNLMNSCLNCCKNGHKGFY